MVPPADRRTGWLVALAAFLLIGALFPVLAVTSLGSIAFLAALAGFLLISGTAVAAVLRARRLEARDSLAQIPPAPSGPTRPARTPGRERSDREVRSGARNLTTEPDTEEARTLKQRLTEAVSDLADNVEEMPDQPTSAGRLSSEQMIARAKRRIEEQGSCR